MSQENKSKIVPDKDLDDLLNSALEDFEKPVRTSEDASTSSASSNLPNPEELWNEEFLKSQAKIFEEKMAELFGSPNGEAPNNEEITLGFQKMAEAAALALQPDTESVVDPQFTQSITEALKGLSTGQENIQSPLNPEDLARMFGGMDMAESGAGNQFLPFMQGMMQSLLSAEVLLPSLKDLGEKYTKWLEDNKDKLSKSDLERYQKQQKLMQTVCAELETEKPDDSAEVKKERFHKVLDNMQKMQDLGQPPEELVGDLGAGAMPMIDPSTLNDPSQCSVM